MRVPAQSAEVANAVVKKLNPTRDTVFARVYTKFVGGYNVSGSEYDGIGITSQYCCPGVPANGTNKFNVDVETVVLQQALTLALRTHMYITRNKGTYMAITGFPMAQ